MQLTKYLFLLTVCASIYFWGCSYNSDPVNSTPVTNKGIYVICKGMDSAVPGDYCYINLEKDTVLNNVFQANNSMNMGSEPYCIYRYLDHDLFISVSGLPTANGKMLHVDSRTNKLVNATEIIGVNLGNFIQIFGEFIYVSRLGSNSLIKMSMDFNTLSASIPVGPYPKDVVFANDRIYVSKFSNTTENSLAMVHYNTDQVVKNYFDAPPVSVAAIINTIYISTYTNKQIYSIVPENPESLADSFNVNINYGAIGDITPGTDNSNLFIIALNNDVGKAIFKLDIPSRTVTPFIGESAGLQSITSIVYDTQYKMLFVTDSKNGLQNGEVRFYDSNGVLQKIYQVGNLNPMKLAIRY